MEFKVWSVLGNKLRYVHKITSILCVYFCVHMFLCMFVAWVIFTHALSHFGGCTCFTYVWASVLGPYLCIFLSVCCIFQYFFCTTHYNHHSQNIYTLTKGKCVMYKLLYIYFLISFNWRLICYPAIFVAGYTYTIRSVKYTLHMKFH